LEKSSEVIWIVCTTKYREGGEKFLRAARTMAEEKKTQWPYLEIVCEAIESKNDFLAALARFQTNGKQIRELNFIGHSGMYGIMFGTRAWPEQFSPHEWQSMDIPFAPGARAAFYACRTGRWFAPFFARTFGIDAGGFTLYTTFSRQRERFSWERSGRDDDPLYVVACPGKKSHGLLGSVKKYFGATTVEAMTFFSRQELSGDATYNSVAELYDQVFTDIRVRSDEWNWLQKYFSRHPQKRVLDIGSGNGALLRQLSSQISYGAGIDKSTRLVELSRQRSTEHENLEFFQTDVPRLPFPDQHFDVVTSLLSFRYLDWDPIMNEILRVLKPGGRILIIDMATAPVAPREYPRFLRDKLKQRLQRYQHRRFYQALQHLVQAQAWKTMLKYNPIRAEHEYRWYLESRFPKSRIDILNIGWNSRVLAFDTGPVEIRSITPQCYP